MAREIARSGGNAEVEVFVKTAGRLDLADVGRFLQRLDIVARRASGGARRGRIDVVGLEVGSLRVKIATRLAVASLVIDGAQLAVAVADGLRSDPAAAKATLALVQDSPGAQVFVNGGGTTVPPVSPEELRRAARRPENPALRAPKDVELLSGPQGGYVREVNREYFVELDSRPDLLIRIRDERGSDDTPLEPDMRYTFDGEAHIGARGRPSYFVLLYAYRIG